MNEEQFKQKYKKQKWEWPHIGDKAKFTGADGMFYPHYTNVIQFAKDNLKIGETYTVRNCEVYSSWCAVWLEEIEGDHFFHLSMFEWPIKEETCFFLETDIVAEIADDNQVRPLICDPDNYPEDSNYCETCDSCGETGCCPPINCQAVKCKYGEINLKDYECTLKQWEIMHSALRELADFDDNKVAINALNTVDKEWDKLYSKE